MALPLRETEPDEMPDIEDLVYNLNLLLGWFLSRGEMNAAATIHHAEQLIKNYVMPVLDPAARWQNKRIRRERKA